MYYAGTQRPTAEQRAPNSGGTIMCNCRSYNQPQEGHETPERVLKVPSIFTHARPTVCVDECIADSVLSLWKAGVWTLGSCCGHGDPDRRCVIVDASDKEKAIKALASIDPTVRVGAWELVFN